MTGKGFRPFFRNPFRHHAISREIDDEFAFHLEAKAKDLEKRGLTSEAARREARAQFGDARHWRRRSLRERRKRRASRAWASLLLDLVGDVRDAVRRLRRRPGFALVAVLVLVGGIGASTAVLAVFDATMFRPMPFPEQDRVVRIFGSVAPRYSQLWMSPANYFDLARRVNAFEATSTTVESTATVFTDGPRRFGALVVESSFFDVVGVDPDQGRRFLPEEERPDAEPVVVLMHDFWETWLGADPGVLGSELRFQAGRVTVVGIMPDGFEIPGHDPVEMLRPYRGDRGGRGWTGVHAPVARLRDDVRMEDASRQVATLMEQLSEAYPAENRVPQIDGPISAYVAPFRDEILFPPQRAFLFLVGGTVILLLVGVSLNTSGLLLAYSVDRRREIAVRAALGADRLRLARSMLVETGILAALGLAGGIVAGHALLEAIVRTAPDVPLIETARIDPRALAACAALTILLWLVSGVAPAALGSRPSIVPQLKEGSRTSSSPIHWTRRAIIVLQFVVACTLVTGAGMATDGFVRLASSDPGFDPQGLAVASLILPRTSYTEPLPPGLDGFGVDSSPGRRFEVTAAARDFTQRTLDRLQALPGVTAAVAANAPPIDDRLPAGYLHTDWIDETIQQRDKRWHFTKWVSPGYFEALGITLLEGRTLHETDAEGSEPVIVVNRALADELRRDGLEPLGTVIPLHHMGPSGPVDVRIVGVVANTVHLGPTDRSPVAYAPFAQQNRLWESSYAAGPLMRAFLVRTERDPEVLLPELRRVIWSVDPDIPLVYVRTMDEMRAEQLRFGRFILFTLAVFAAFTLLLAAAGTFALLAQAVKARSHEIGIRRALGSSTSRVALRFLADGGRMAALGIAFGLGASFLLYRVMTARLAENGDVLVSLGIDGWSGVSLTVGVIVLLAAGALGSSGPAWVATRMDPLDAIRTE